MFDPDTNGTSNLGSPPSKSDGLSTNTAVANTSASNANAENAKSAAAEIAISHDVSKTDPVGNAIKRCKAVAKGESVFKASVAHIYEGLTEAYPWCLDLAS